MPPEKGRVYNFVTKNAEECATILVETGETRLKRRGRGNPRKLCLFRQGGVPAAPIGGRPGEGPAFFWENRMKGAGGLLSPAGKRRVCTSMKILFVCTGNTCRSPMAEGIFRKMMVERGMEERVLCQSAGLSAVEGAPVSENAVLVCREIGVDISDHTARRISGEELSVWDLYFPMSKTHGYILAQAGVPQTKIYIPKYIADPYGAPLEDYRACRDKLVQQLEVFYESYVTRLLVFDNTMPPPPPFPEGSRPRP